MEEGVAKKKKVSKPRNRLAVAVRGDPVFAQRVVEKPRPKDALAPTLKDWDNDRD